MSRKQTVLVTGYAKAPKGTGMYEVYRHAGIVLELDPETGEILDVEFTFVTDLAKRFLRELLLGYRLEEDHDEILQAIRDQYLAPSSEAIVAALKGALQRYREKRASVAGTAGSISK